METKNYLDFEVEIEAYREILKECIELVKKGNELKVHQVKYLYNNINLANSTEKQVINFICTMGIEESK